MCISIFLFVFFFFKQKTAYEMRISDWSSDVCSSDLGAGAAEAIAAAEAAAISAAEAAASAAEAEAIAGANALQEIGRASCRERVSVRVDLGGRRIIKKKKKVNTVDDSMNRYQITKN